VIYLLITQFLEPNNIKWQGDLSLMNCTGCAKKQVSPNSVKDKRGTPHHRKGLVVKFVIMMYFVIGNCT